MLLTLFAAAVLTIGPKSPEVGVVPPKIVERAPVCPNLRPVLTPAAQATAPDGFKGAYDNRPLVVTPRVFGAPTTPMFAVPHPLTVEPPAALCSATPVGPPIEYK